MKYIFILGNNPELSVAEIQAVVPNIEIIEKNDRFLVAKSEQIDCSAVMQKLGGTIKIAEVIGEKTDKKQIIDLILDKKGASKVNFGFSYYAVTPDKLGFEIKKDLKAQGISCRLVVSREKDLSSVIVKKNKVIDFVVLPNYIGVTRVVQDFEEYSRRDFGRPASDAVSGMIPPKLAKMMINLSGDDTKRILLDPFCGSGTILAEAIVAGYSKFLGSDNSEKAIRDSRENIKWLIENEKIKPAPEYKIYKLDVRKLFTEFQDADVIVSEPYLGTPIRGGESEKDIGKIIAELEDLYLDAFGQFKQVLSGGGKIVIVIPQWHIRGKIYNMNIFSAVERLGFKRLDKADLMYKRKSQKVWRQITIWENSGK